MSPIASNLSLPNNQMRELFKYYIFKILNSSETTNGKFGNFVS